MLQNIIKSSGFQKVNKCVICVISQFAFTLQGCHQTCNKPNWLSIIFSNLNLGKVAEILCDLRSLGLKHKDEVSIILIKERRFFYMDALSRNIYRAQRRIAPRRHVAPPGDTIFSKLQVNKYQYFRGKVEFQIKNFFFLFKSSINYD